MEIQEAIIHARQVAEGCSSDNKDCAYQHDKLADWLEELQRYQKAESEGKMTIFPCAVGSHVYLNTSDSLTPRLCSVQGYHLTLRRNYVRLYPIIQPKDWLGNQSYYYKVALSSFGKTWFLTLEEAKRALRDT